MFPIYSLTHFPFALLSIRSGYPLHVGLSKRQNTSTRTISPSEPKTAACDIPIHPIHVCISASGNPCRPMQSRRAPAYSGQLPTDTGALVLRGTDTGALVLRSTDTGVWQPRRADSRRVCAAVPGGRLTTDYHHHRSDYHR